MPNWNSAEDVKKWLESQDKGKKKGTNKPKESKPAPKKPELHLKDLKPAPKGNAWRRNWEESKPPPQRIGPSPKSSYEAPGYDPNADSPWQRKDELPNAQGGRRTGLEEITPYTNYQALPRFVTEQRRNPAGGYGGIREAQGYIGSESQQVGFGSVDPAWNYYGEVPMPFEPDPRQFQVNDTPDFHVGINGRPVRQLENPPWGYGPAPVQFQELSPNWRPANDLWRRIRDADIVPYGQAVPLGQQMHPSFGPLPQSSYMDLRKYNFERA
jgi:hypothetical protein